MKVRTFNLDYFVAAVEENNRNNDGKWKYWKSGKEIIESYTNNGEDVEDREYVEMRLDEIIDWSRGFEV